MGRVAIVTDSTADLPPSLREAHGITMVPLNVHFGTETFRDQVDLSTEEFMARLTGSEVIPTTSQPATGLFEETFRDLAANHDDVVAILISSKLSGTVMSATLAADALRSLIKVEIVDSQSASMGLGLQVLSAAHYAREGRSASEIGSSLRATHRNYETLFYVDTLDFLRRGGRIGKASALLGTLLDLKPLLRIDEGQVVPAERTRTRARARKELVDFVRGQPHVERLAIMHVSMPDEASTMADEFTLAVPRNEIVIGQFGPVIGTHLGPGAMGVIIDTGSVPR
ncbi:MAG: DegV family protein [Thermomicrobiales bacterium]|jgi:DegV family protein with EDD domain